MRYLDAREVSLHGAGPQLSHCRAGLPVGKLWATVLPLSGRAPWMTVSQCEIMNAIKNRREHPPPPSRADRSCYTLLEDHTRPCTKIHNSNCVFFK